MTLALRRLAATLTVLFVAGCNLAQLIPGQSPTPSPTRPPAWVPQTAWEKALEKIDEDGHFSLQAALDLFATAFGPLPGTNVQQDLTGVHDMTIAVNAVESHATELSAEQATVVADYLAPPPNSVTVTVDREPSALRAPMAAAAALEFAAVDEARKDELKTIANNFRDIYVLKLGFDIPNFDVVYTDRPPTEKPISGQFAGGFAHAEYGADGNNSGCKITIFNESISNGDQVLRSLLAHEIFHCFQYAGYGTLAALGAAPKWVIEGQAAWVGQAVGGVSGKYDRFWDQYILLPQKPLTTRSYDAIGFYAHLDERGISPWDAFKPMWAAGANNIEIYKESGANVDDFIDTWASGVLREESRGDGWDTTGPGITASKYPPLSIGIADGIKVNVSQPFFTNDITHFQFDVDLVHFDIDGHGRLNDDNIDTTALDNVWYCVVGHDCEKEPKCPDAPPKPPVAGTINAAAYLATSGAIDGTVGIVEGRDIDNDKKPCDTPTPTASGPTPPPSQPEPGNGDEENCVSDCGMSNGDPHIYTLDNHVYDFQAAGEFVLLRNADRTFEVHVRQQPYGDSDHVSINTAVAMKVGGHKAGIYATRDGNDATATLDGNQVTTTTDIDGGGRIRREGSGWRIEFPDGTRLDVLGTGNYGLNLLLKPSASLRMTAAGLWGPVGGGEFLRIPALPDGTSLPAATDGHDYYQKLYVQFADAWRISQADSLFDYSAGTTTDTYTVRPFPAEQSVLTIDDLTPEQRQRGEEACKSISIEFLHDQCVFDVGLTGEAGFVAVYDVTANVVATGNLTASGQRYRIVNLYSDASTAGSDQLDIYGWDSYASFTDANAGLLTTVGYEQVSDFFDPGVAADTFGNPISQISIQRRGQPPNAFQLNLYDRPIDAVPGTVLTLLLTPDAADKQNFSVGGREIYDDLIFEKHPGDNFLPQPLPDQGLLVADVTGLVHGLDAPSYFYVSVGDGCLADPEFPTVLAHIGGGGGESSTDVMAVPPGSHTLTLHAGPPNGAMSDDFRCDNEPLAPGVPITIGAGQLSSLFVYATPGNPQLKVLVLPYGQ